MYPLQKGKHCEVLSTFTLGKLEREGAKSLERWLKRYFYALFTFIYNVLQMRNLLECDLVLIPLNVKACHWALMVSTNK